MKDVKILITNAPSKRKYIKELRCQQSSKKLHMIHVPITMLTIAATIKKEVPKSEIHIFDNNVEPGTYSYKLNNIIKANFDIFIVATSTSTLKEDLHFCRRIKEETGAKIIIFGSTATYFHKRILEENHKYIDYVALFEPEMPIAQLIKSIKCPPKIRRIKGVAFYDNKSKKIVSNSVHNAVDLSTLKIDYSLIKVRQYKIPLLNIPYGMILTKRGCYFNCDFCVVPYLFNREIEENSVDNIIKSIIQLHNKYGIKFFWFFDEDIFSDSIFFEKLYSAILKLPFKINFAASSRLDSLDHDKIKKLKRAGCFLLSIGVESLDLNVLNRMNKKLRLSDEEVVKKLFEVSRELNVNAHLVFGYEKTKSEIERTIRIISKSPILFANFYMATPFPGTKLFERTKITEETPRLLEILRTFDYEYAREENNINYKKEIRRAYFTFYSNLRRLLRINIFFLNLMWRNIR